MLSRLSSCLLVRIFLVVTIDYIGDANSVIVIFFLQLLLSKLLNISCLFSSLWNPSAIPDPEVCNTKILLLVSSHQISNAIKSLSFALGGLSAFTITTLLYLLSLCCIKSLSSRASSNISWNWCAFFFALIWAKLKLIFLLALREITIWLGDRRLLGYIALYHIDIASSVLKIVHEFVNFLAIWGILDFHPIYLLII